MSDVHSSPNCTPQTPCDNCKQVAIDGIRSLVEQLNAVFENAVIAGTVAAQQKNLVSAGMSEVFWAVYGATKKDGLEKLFSREPAELPPAPVVETVAAEVVEVVAVPQKKERKARKPSTKSKKLNGQTPAEEGREDVGH